MELNKKFKALLIGYGYWGYNIAKTITKHPNIELAGIAESNPEKLLNAQNDFANVPCNLSYQSLVQSQKYHLVFVATPVQTHFEIVLYCLNNGLHIFCEKILSPHVIENQVLFDLAIQKSKMLYVDYTFLNNSIVQYVKETLQTDSLGTITQVSLKRCGYGPVRNDVDVIHDLAPHDLSMLIFWFGLPETVSVVKTHLFSADKCDAAFIQLTYPNQLIASIQVSWIHPLKERKIEIVGKKGMIIFDDMSILEKLKIIRISNYAHPDNFDIYNSQLHIKSGDISIPNIPYPAPLEVSINYFMQRIEQNKDLNGHKIFNIQLTKLLNKIETSYLTGSIQSMLDVH